MAQGCNGDLGSLESLRALPREGLPALEPPVGPHQHSLVDLVREAPAVAGVAVAMPRVDEAILQRLADVLG